MKALGAKKILDEKFINKLIKKVLKTHFDSLKTNFDKLEESKNVKTLSRDLSENNINAYRPAKKQVLTKKIKIIE